MMTHVFENASGQRIIAAKGAPEALLAVSDLTLREKATIKEQVAAMAAEGYRVLAVGRAEAGMLPATQQELRFSFVSVLWYEIFKYFKRRHQSSTDVPINGTAASKP